MQENKFEANKREVFQKMEKRELITSVEKREFSSQNTGLKTEVRCVSCNKIIAEVDELEMGRVLLKCGHCGVKNNVDKSSTITGRGRYL